MIIEEDQQMPPFDTSDLKILIVDDEASFRKLAKIALSKRGFPVHLAEAGEEAIAKIYYEDPQIGLLDVMMPRLTGDKLVKMIKQWKPEIRVFMVTSHLSKDIEEDCLQNGANGCFEKPLDFDRFVDSVKQSLQ